MKKETYIQYKTNFQPHIDYIMDFLSKHNITKLDLNDAYQYTMVHYSINPLPIVKLLAIMVYIQFNNIEYSELAFKSYADCLKLDLNQFDD